MTLLESIETTASRFPDKAFLATRTVELTYGDVLARARALADRIATVGAFDRPCLIKADHIAASIGILACLTLRKPFIVVNPNSPDDRLDYYHRDSGANVLVEANSSQGADPQRSEQIVVSGLAASTDVWRTVDSATQVACLIYTSGSTGQPKAVVCPEPAMSFAVTTIATTLGYCHTDVILSALPMFFDFGLYQLFLAGQVGATLYFASALESGLGLGDALHRTAATVLPMVPPAAEKLANLAKRGLSPHAVRMITTTGAALDHETRLTLQQAWDSKVDVRVMYGLTECKRVAIMPAFESSRRTKASGLPLPGTTITIRPHQGDAVLNAGEVGEICVEGPHVMAGYHNQPELTALRYKQSATGIVLRTGDTGFLDKDGYLHCLGRDDAQFKVQGYRVSASEVVAAAKAAPDVISAAVVPPVNGRRYTLFFQGAADEDSVTRVVSERLEPYAIPKHIRRVDIIPTNANGKVDLKQLEKEVQRG